MLILSGSTPLYVLLLRGSGTPRYRPSSGCPIGRLVLDDDLDVAHRRTEIGRQGSQRVVNRLFERIIETRPERASISAMVPERQSTTHRPDQVLLRRQSQRSDRPHRHISDAVMHRSRDPDRPHPPNRIQRPINEAHRRLQRARRREIGYRIERNENAQDAVPPQGRPSTSPYCIWINDPLEPESCHPIGNRHPNHHHRRIDPSSTSATETRRRRDAIRRARP